MTLPIPSNKDARGVIYTEVKDANLVWVISGEHNKQLEDTIHCTQRLPPQE